MSASLKVASFTVHADARQSARWKIAAEVEGFTSAGAWLAGAADAYLKARARAGQPLPLAWRRGVFKVLLDGEERTVRGHVSPPFGAFRGDGSGRHAPGRHFYRLAYLPSGRILATMRSYRECKALAAELARLWVRGDGSEPAEDPRAILSARR